MESDINSSTDNVIDRDALRDLLDAHFADDLSEEHYAIEYIDPRSLITANRLDIAIKILYLEMRPIEHVEFAEQLYIEHARAFSLGSFREPGNDEKSGVEAFLDSFDECYNSISREGFDSTRGIVPLSADGTIANGAHRVASAYVAGVPVPTVRLTSPPHRYDARFFVERGMSREMIETAVTHFIESADDCYLAIIWPSATGHENGLKQMIPRIIYTTEVELNYNGAHNLISQIYYSEPWLGARCENYPGAKAKLVECFKRTGPVRIFAFQAESLTAVQTLKQQIRDLFGIGKHSVHISDTKPEAVRIARMLFNPNSIHFLNHGQPNRFPAAIDGVLRFKAFLDQNGINANRCLIDSSHVLTVYGLRESQDIDYLSLDEAGNQEDLLIHNHAGELEHYEQSLGELILNQGNYFHFEDLKFLAFDALYEMKRRRGEKKDRNDLMLMDSLIEKNPLKNHIARGRQKIFYWKAKTKMQLIGLLQLLGIYKGVRYLYRLFR